MNKIEITVFINHLFKHNLEKIDYFQGEKMKNIMLSILTLLSATFIGSGLNAEKIETSGQPALGDSQAKVQVVAFLEPKCPDSKRYNNASFPKLKSEYIDTKKVRYTVITTSFLSNSMPAAIALLSVYHQDPNKPNSELFFKYLNYIYQNQPPERDNWATLETLQKFAANASPEINLDHLKKSIETEEFKSQIEKNTAYGNKVMGHLSTPTIYVNGVKIENSDETIDYEKLKTAIEQAL